MKADSGKINLNGKKVKLLRQEIERDKYNLTVIDYIKNDNGFLELENRLHSLEENLNEENMKEYGDILDAYLKLNGYDFETNLEVIMNGLNMNIDINSKVGELSGGQKIKVLHLMN